MRSLHYDHDPDADPRSIECDEWARKKGAEMRVWQPEIQVVFVKIVPALPEARYLGEYKLSNGKIFKGSNWAYHWAVLSNGVARDEIYPYGVTYEAYKKLFSNREYLSFDEYPEVS